MHTRVPRRAMWLSGILAFGLIVVALGTIGARSARAVGVTPSTITVSTNVNPAVYGQSVTLTATVTAATPGGPTPTGSVTFLNGSTGLATKKLVGGQASYTTTYSVGTRTISGTYNGDTTYATSVSTPFDLVVTPTPTTTVVASSANPATSPSSVTLTATVSAASPGNGSPSSGSVKFYDGATLLASRTPTAGVASYSFVPAIGAHSITATFGGSASYLASTSVPLAQIVNPALSTTELTSSANPVTVDAPVTFTATVTSANTVTGSVTFTDGTTTLGSGPLVNGTATLTTSALAVGTHTVTATYSGSSTVAASAGTVDQTITPLVPAATTTTIAADNNAPTYSTPVTFTATVTSAGGTPTGDVTFAEGPTPIGVATLTNGQASIVTSALGVGPHTVVAHFGGGPGVAASDSSELVVVVTEPASPTTTVISSSLNPAVVGTPITFSATVTGSGTPTGNVTFLANGTTLGTGALVDGVATFTTTGLAPGTTAMSATYDGGTQFAPSGSPELVQTVNRIPTTVLLGASPNPAGIGQPVTLSASVSSANGVPSGTVTFTDGTTAMATVALSDGTATMTTATLAPGPHALTATYNGSPNFAPGTSAPVTETVSGSLVFVDQANPACKTTGTGAGTFPTPYCTINAAAAKVTPGVTVQVATGTYTEKVTIGASGNASAPITLTPLPGASVTVANGANGFVLTNKSYVTIRGFTIDGTKNPGITVSGGSNITVDGNRVSHAGTPVSGSTAVGIKLSGATDSVVVNNITDHNSDAGILVTTDANNNVISHNESYANARVYTRAAAGIDIRSSTGNVVIGNVTHDNEDSGINLWTGLAQGSNLATNNVVYANGDHGIDCHNAIDVRVIANTVVGNYDSGIEMTNSTGSILANNISVDNGIGSLRTSGNIRADAASSPTATVNDDLVFLRTPGVMIDWGGVKYSSLAAFRAATGQESRGTEADPRFTDAIGRIFRLLAGSPAIDAANSAAPGQPVVDFDGFGRYDDVVVDTGTGPITFADRGAFEHRP